MQRLGVDQPIRATDDSDFGVVPCVLREGAIITEIETVGYERVAGNRWERTLDGRRVAAVDLLVPAYTSRARDTVTIGDVVTTEVPGLAYALQQSPVVVDVELVLTDGSSRSATLVLPDVPSTLVLKALARTVRTETREALWQDFAAGGAALDAVTTGLQDDAAQVRTRLRALLLDVVGPEG